MKFFLTILALLLTSFIGYSQDYVPFPTDTATWTQASYHFHFYTGWYSDQYEMNGDTIISDLSYKKIYLNAYGHPNFGGQTYYVGALREDDENRVYFKPDSIYIQSNIYDPFNTAIFEVDSVYLLYDFNNLAIGDTIEYNNAYASPPSLDYYYIIDDIFSASIGNIERKVYQLTTPFYIEIEHEFEFTYLIEGIGSSKGLLSPYGRYQSEFHSYILTCYEEENFFWTNGLHDNDLTTYISNCDVINTSIKEENSEGLAVYPNPSSGVFNIELTHPSDLIIIRNSVGETIRMIASNDLKFEVDISDLKTGSYIIQFSRQNQLYYERFIKL